MLINTRMSYFYSYFFTMIFGNIYLADWTWGQWLRIELFKNLIYLLSIIFFEVFFRFLKRVFRCIFSEMYKFLSHHGSYNISSMTKILKRFDPYNTCFFYGWYKQIKPNILCFIKKKERKRDYGWSEYQPKLKESDNMPKCINYTLYESLFFFFCSICYNDRIFCWEFKILLIAFHYIRLERFSIKI